jgi:hypothetical protein
MSCIVRWMYIKCSSAKSIGIENIDYYVLTVFRSNAFPIAETAFSPESSSIFSEFVRPDFCFDCKVLFSTAATEY